MGKYFKAAAAATLALLIALLLLGSWLLFSPDRLRSGIASMLSGKGVSEVAISSCRPAFPLGMRMSGVAVRFRKGASLEAGELVVRFRFASLLGGRLSLDFDAGAYGGRINGKLEFLRAFSASGPFRLALDFAGIRVSECKFLDSPAGLLKGGIARGSLDYRAAAGRNSQGEGALRIAVREADFKSRIPALAGGFNSAEAEASWQGNAMQIRKFHLSGRDVQGSFRGRVFLHDDFSRSRLSMKGDFAPAGNPRQAFSVVVTGTVAEPAANLIQDG